MTHKLIKTDNYLLAVDPKEVTDKESYNVHDLLRWVSKGNILAHLPLNGSPVLEGVDLLPHYNDDVKQLANTYSESQVSLYPELNNSTNEWGRKLITAVGVHSYVSFHAGYEAACDKYKYTDEDLENILLDFIEFQHPYSEPRGSIVDRFIKQLNTPTEWSLYSKYPTEFESTIGVCSRWLADECNTDCCGNPEKRITTTINGRRTWVGKYK